jgi:HSP20 family molecular chaperone IbpA
VDADKIEANYKQGVLTIFCPKKEEAKPKAIEIKAT